MRSYSVTTTPIGMCVPGTWFSPADITSNRTQSDGKLRATTMEEKQNLLLHEILHIALGKDDDDLNSRALCPLRLLAFCPRDSNREYGHRSSPASE